MSKPAKIIDGHYCCPECDEAKPNNTYYLGNTEYPIIFNEQSDKDSISWEEIHVCAKCKTEFLVEQKKAIE